jgi:hypothetical protein
VWQLDPDGVCPGSCNSTYRRRRALYEADAAEYARKLELLRDGDEVPEPPQPPDISPWYGSPVWCGKCMSSIREQLAELDDLAALAGAIPPLARPADDGSGKVTGTRSAPSPSARMDDLEDLNSWLRSWEAAARDEDDPRPRRGILARESTTLTAWLYHHYDVLILNPDAAKDFGEEVKRWHRDLVKRAAAGQIRRHQKRPCPRCDLYTLWLTVGDEYVKCVNDDCGRVLSRQEYDALTDAA